MTQLITQRLLLGVLSLSLASCSFLTPVKSTQLHTYTLSVGSLTNKPSRDKTITLMVNTPTASAGYQSRKMIYNKQNFELSAFTKNQWAGPPAQMLKPIILQAIRNTGYFHAVIATPISASRNMRLKVSLIELRQDFTRCPSHINMALQASIINDKTNKVIDSRVFSARVRALSDTPYAGVIAANRATDQLMRQLANFCVDNMVRGKAMPRRGDNHIHSTIKLPIPTV